MVSGVSAGGEGVVGVSDEDGEVWGKRGGWFGGEDGGGGGCGEEGGEEDVGVEEGDDGWHGN